MVQSIAERAVADLIVILQAHDEPVHRDAPMHRSARRSPSGAMLAREQPAVLIVRASSSTVPV